MAWFLSAQLVIHSKLKATRTKSVKQEHSLFQITFIEAVAAEYTMWLRYTAEQGLDHEKVIFSLHLGRKGDIYIL